MSQAFNILSGDAQVRSTQKIAKLAEYSRVSSGVDAFNVANQQGNYIKDVLGTGEHLAKDAAIELGSLGAKKAVGAVVSKTGKVLDTLRGTKGGAEGFGNRLKTDFTNLKRMQMKNNQNARDQVRLKQNRAIKEKRESNGTEEDADPETSGQYERGDHGPVDDDEVDTDAATGDGAADAAGDATGDAADAAADIGETLGEDLAADAPELLADAGATLGEVALEGGLDVLDATGIGAIIGVPLQIATGVGLVWGGIDFAKDITHDLSNLFGSGDTRGNQAAPPPPKFVSNILAPTQES